MYILGDCEPKRVFKRFEDISRIPRGSGNEAGIARFIENFAQNLGLYAKLDGENNVIIRKPGTFRLKDAATVILQGHLDMVCEKNEGTVHDFENDGLELYTDGDFVKARGTTLGADNGIAVACAMALLESDDIEHPPLEVVLTTNEETGLTGAANLSPDDLTGKYLINLDSEEEGVFYASCAGGVRVNINIPVKTHAVPAGSGQNVYSLAVTGLKGGHSGMDIDKERGNANKLLGRVLYEMNKKSPVNLVSIKGGAKDNAIPREAFAFMVCGEREAELLKEIAGEYGRIFEKELRRSDPGVCLTFEKTDETASVCFCEGTTRNIIRAIYLMKNGINSMSSDIAGLVESSSNLGVITYNDEKGVVTLTNAVRSSVATRKHDIVAQLQIVADITGAGEIETRGDYPSWEYKSDSPFRKRFVDTYNAMNGVEPKIAAIHAGLECGLFAEKVEGIEMISMGPDMHDVHTPDERLSISSVERFWAFLVKVLGELNL